MASSCYKWLAVFGVILIAACGGDDDVSTYQETDASGGGGRSNRCIDEDGDGYGEGHCPYGSDCDDDDPDVGDECIRCPLCDDCLEEGRDDCDTCPGCPCEEGTPSVPCELPIDLLDQYVTECHEGVMNCREGEWSECETATDWLGT
jgi:hypothetical protein